MVLFSKTASVFRYFHRWTYRYRSENKTDRNWPKAKQNKKLQIQVRSPWSIGVSCINLQTIRQTLESIENRKEHNECSYFEEVFFESIVIFNCAFRLILFVSMSQIISEFTSNNRETKIFETVFASVVRVGAEQKCIAQWTRDEWNCSPTKRCRRSHPVDKTNDWPWHSTRSKW